MQDVETVVVPRGQIDSPLGCDACRFGGSNERVIGDLIGTGESGGISANGRFVLAVGADWQGRVGENGFKRLLFVDEEVPRAATDENFDTGHFGS